MAQRLTRWYWMKVVRVFRRLAREKGTTERIAMGAALGMFIGMTPTVGFQMIIAFTVASIFRVNRLAAVVPVWITNPATVIPIYSFNYWLGLWFWRGPSISEFVERLKIVLNAATEIGFFGLFTPQSEGSVGAFVLIQQLGGLGVDILVPLWIGCSIVGIVLAVPTYPIMLRLIAQLRTRRDEKRAARHRRISQRLGVSASPPDSRQEPNVANDDTSKNDRSPEEPKT